MNPMTELAMFARANNLPMPAGFPTRVKPTRLRRSTRVVSHSFTATQYSKRKHKRKTACDSRRRNR
jgi:hypothetical protein